MDLLGNVWKDRVHNLEWPQVVKVDCRVQAYMQKEEPWEMPGEVVMGTILGGTGGGLGVQKDVGIAWGEQTDGELECVLQIQLISPYF